MAVALAVCETCPNTFKPRSYNQKSCTPACRKAWSAPRRSPGTTAANSGAAVELLISANLMLDGWVVFRALNPNSPVDIIACRDGVTRYIECRMAVRTRDGISYPKTRHDGYPRPTEIAACVPSEVFVDYFPAE